MSQLNKFSPEVRERAVKIVQEQRGDYPSLCAAIETCSSQLRCRHEAGSTHWALTNDSDQCCEGRAPRAPPKRNRTHGKKAKSWIESQRVGVLV